MDRMGPLTTDLFLSSTLPMPIVKNQGGLWGNIIELFSLKSEETDFPKIVGLWQHLLRGHCFARRVNFGGP